MQRKNGLKYWNNLIPAAAFTAVFLAGPSTALAYGHGRWGDGLYYGFIHGGFGGLIMIVFWSAVATGLILLVKWIIQGGREGDREIAAADNALSILKERYARGEIGQDDYYRMRDEIESA